MRDGVPQKRRRVNDPPWPMDPLAEPDVAALDDLLFRTDAADPLSAGFPSLDGALQQQQLAPVSCPLPMGPSFRTLPPIRDALGTFRDGTPLIATLAIICSYPSNAAVPVDQQRRAILDFTGLPQSAHPPIELLRALNRNDLDALAWAFGLSRTGRKIDVATRIADYLRAPLRYRQPGRRRPTGAGAPYGRAQNQQPAVTSVADRTNAAVVAATAAAAVRSSMPNLMQMAPAPPQRTRNLLGNLARHLQPGSDGLGVTASSTESRARSQQNQYQQPRLGSRSGSLPTPSAIRARQSKDAIMEMVMNYSFMAPETPFNAPLNAPLGEPRVLVFTAAQLSRGTQDPTLLFRTPPAVSAHLRPEVAGGDVQVHLRCLRIEAGKPCSQWKQAWPFPATSRVNGHAVALNQAQRYTNGKLAGKDSATNISPFLRKRKPSGSDQNKVSLRRQSSTASASQGMFVMYVQEVIVYSQETMMKMVTERSERHWTEHRKSLENKGQLPATMSKFEMAQQGVVHFLTSPDGVTVSSMKVSLRCPLGLTRIAVPVKGRRCMHVQCFDLNNFLEYSRRSSKFECPVCNKPTAEPTMLVISPYIEHALDTYKDSDEVEIFQDGSMIPVVAQRKGVASDDEDDDDGAGGGGSQVIKARTGGGGGAVVVDLTLDSDDDGGARADSSAVATFGGSRGASTAPVAMSLPSMVGYAQPQQPLRQPQQNAPPTVDSRRTIDTNGWPEQQQPRPHSVDGGGALASTGLPGSFEASFQAPEQLPFWNEFNLVPDPPQTTSSAQGAGGDTPVPSQPFSHGSGAALDDWSCDVIALDSD